MSGLQHLAKRVRRLEADLHMARSQRDLEIIHAHVSGMTERAIAEVVGISAPAVHQIISRRRMRAVEAARSMQDGAS